MATSTTTSTSSDGGGVPVELPDLTNLNAFIADILDRRGHSEVGGNPHWFAEFGGGTLIEVTAFEPDPATYRCQYYYNAILNQLYKKIVTLNDPETGMIIAHWKPISDIQD